MKKKIINKKLVISPKQRLEIYKRALKEIETTLFLCVALSPDEAFQSKYGYYRGVDYFLSHFPEVYKQKPKEPYLSSCWFAYNETEKRKRILRKAIKEVKLKIKK